jgi:integrase/recombinase XerD
MTDAERLDVLGQSSFVRVRQNAAPLRREREQYLIHLLNQGTSPAYVRAVAGRLVHINRILDMSEPRAVSSAEVEGATQKWLRYVEDHQSRGVRPSSAYTFHNAAENWLRFHSLLIASEQRAGRFDTELQCFLQFVATCQPSTDSVRNQRARISVFLAWAGERYTRISDVSLIEVDQFLDEKRRSGLKPRSLASYCHSLRTFFRYAAHQGWSQPTIARGIKSPPVHTFEEPPRGPSWKDVRRMLDAPIGKTPAELRTAAILSLCALYAMRGIEVRRLLISDFDWINETLVVRRAKRGPIQQFPLQYEVGQAVLRYMRYGRPRCYNSHLFVTLKPPYRPMHQCVLAALVKSRMKALNVVSMCCGTHSLRHACATELLRQGSSLVEIADFLGHRSIESVSIYAKLDHRSLRQVATFSLAGVR